MPSAVTRHPPEILAPAGSREAFLAALDAGADAVYLGLKEGSARGRAHNFTVDDLQQLLPLAHSEQRRVYVALNTLLKEAEVAPTVATVAALQELGIDALIVQDLGLWHACRELFPDLPLHASTQMTIHNAAGVRQLEHMGFARAILARECTLPEIRAIRATSQLPLEVFVHGALCYSVSGMCYASSAITGASANRGWCNQPCRWHYRRDRSETGFHPLSPSDQTWLEHLRELAAAGVGSLKIEGRLKGPDYVRAVVGAMRKVLDAGEDQAASALGAAREILKSAPTRPATAGYALHPQPKEVLRKGANPTLGTPIGAVRRWRQKTVTVSSKQPIRRGDRLRIFSTRRGQSVAVTVRSLRREKSGAGVLWHIPVSERVERGDRVYRVKESSAEAYLQELSKRARALPATKGVPLHLKVRCSPGELQLRARVGAVTLEQCHHLTMHPAERHPLDYATLEKHLGRVGAGGYRLDSLQVEGELPPVVIPPSEFKELRRCLLQALDAARAEGAAQREQALAALRQGEPAARGEDKQLWVRVETLAAAKMALDHRPHRLVFPLVRDLLRARDRLLQQLQRRDAVVWELPPWLAEGDVARVSEQLQTLVREGYSQFAVTNLAHLDLLRDHAPWLCAGRELHCLNGWAAAALRQLGCSAATLSPETDADNLQHVAAGGWPLRPLAIAYANLPLFTTRLDPGVVWPEGNEIHTGENVTLFWSRAPRGPGSPWARVYRSLPLSWSQHMAGLRAGGVGDFVFDFEGRLYTRKEMGILLKKFRTERSLKDASDWNFSRTLK